MRSLESTTQPRVVKADGDIPILVEIHGRAELICRARVVINSGELPRVSLVARARQPNVQTIALINEQGIDHIFFVAVHRETQIGSRAFLGHRRNPSPEANTGSGNLSRVAEIKPRRACRRGSDHQTAARVVRRSRIKSPFIPSDINRVFA